MKVKPEKRMDDNLKLPIDKTILAVNTDSNSLPSATDEWQNKEWANDEDMLFARLIVVRLKKFNARDKRVVGGLLLESHLLDKVEDFGVDRRERRGGGTVQTCLSVIIIKIRPVVNIFYFIRRL